MLVMAALSAVTPYLFRLFADNLSDDMVYFTVGILIFAVYLLAETQIKMLWTYLLDGFGGEYIKDLSLRSEAKLISARLSDIELTPENIKHIIYYDILSIFSVVAVYLPMMLKSLIVVIAACIIGFFFGTVYAAVIFIAFILGLLLSFASRKMIAAASRRTNVKMKAHNATALEFVDNLALAQTNSLQEYYRNKTALSIDDFIATAKREDLKTYFWSGAVENYNQLFSILLSALLALPFAGSSIVNLVYFTMLADIIMMQGMNVQAYLLSVMKMRVCFENVDKILNFKGREGARSLTSVGSIEFKDVTFGYRDGVNVLQNFSCSMRRGEAVRIAGGNGSGKSTVTKLICGLYAPKSGQILFDGADSREFLQADINRRVAYIGQEEPLLDENLCDYLSIISGRKVDEEMFARLCRAVDFEDGNIQIMEEGKSLSPGQRKKIMIMKYLLLKDGASVIILDETFAGLDAEGRDKFTALINEDIARGGRIYPYRTR